MRIRLNQYGDAIATPKMNDNTFEVWRGNSLIDDAEIVVLMSGITRPSINGKTLDMIQISIVRTDVSPLEAVQLGLDESICGGCNLRPFIAQLAKLKAQLLNDDTEINECYVDKTRGIGGTWQSWNSGKVAKMSPLEACILISQLKQCNCEKPHKRKQSCSNKSLGVRFGSYGDPASVPVHVWDDIRSVFKAMETSYTHRWDEPIAQALKAFTMASIDSQTHPDVHKAIDYANKLGWRTYRVLKEGETLRDDEILCPEASGKTNCANCGLCSGNQRPKTPNIAIPAIV